jgi:hypothetical protein
MAKLIDIKRVVKNNPKLSKKGIKIFFDWYDSSFMSKFKTDEEILNYIEKYIKNLKDCGDIKGGVYD